MMVRRGVGAYAGTRTDQTYCTVIGPEGQLSPRFDLRNHSPAGFNWGYGGSGPAQLALALCADALGDELAQVLYQRFKRDFVSRWGKDEFRLQLSEIQQWALEALLSPDLHAIERLKEQIESNQEEKTDGSEPAATGLGSDGGRVNPDQTTTSGLGGVPESDTVHSVEALPVAEIDTSGGSGEMPASDARPPRNRKTR